MIKQVVTDYNFYNDRADEVIEEVGIDIIFKDLKDTLIKNRLVCLAAPQIGYKNRIIAMDFKGDIRYFINPSIIDTRGTMGFDIETCPSVPDTKFAVLRYPEIHVSYFDENLKVAEHPMCMIGMAAMHMQKAIDILDGRLICDGSLPILDGWEKLKPSEQDEIFKEWIEVQNKATEEVKEEIKQDEALNEISNAIDFMQSVAKGETKLMSDKELEEMK